jgi:hypothetical protein
MRPSSADSGPIRPEAHDGGGGGGPLQFCRGIGWLLALVICQIDSITTENHKDKQMPIMTIIYGAHGVADPVCPSRTRTRRGRAGIPADAGFACPLCVVVLHGADATSLAFSSGPAGVAGPDAMPHALMDATRWWWRGGWRVDERRKKPSRHTHTRPPPPRNGDDCLLSLSLSLSRRAA